MLEEDESKNAYVNFQEESKESENRIIINNERILKPMLKGKILSLK
jgi:hypothetical protein